jgi:hypothetical protein
VTPENQEAGIRNHGRGAIWLIRLGAVLVLSLAPLMYLFFELWSVGYLPARHFKIEPALSYEDSMLFNYSRPNVIGSWAGLLILVAPSLAATIWPGLPRLERATLVAFLPISGLSAWMAGDVAPFFGPGPFMIPPWAAAAPAVAGAAGVFLACFFAGVDRFTLATFSRRWLAGMILWLVALHWNSFGMSPRWFPGWVGAAGAALILRGEILARPAPVILDS